MCRESERERESDAHTRMAQGEVEATAKRRNGADDGSGRVLHCFAFVCLCSHFLFLLCSCFFSALRSPRSVISFRPSSHLSLPLFAPLPLVFRCFVCVSRLSICLVQCFGVSFASSCCHECTWSTHGNDKRHSHILTDLSRLQ